MRVGQWSKNVLLFAPLLFALAFSVDNWLTVLLGFFAFSFLASAIYIINDLADRSADRAHPIKKLRPIAADLIKPIPACLIALICLSIALGLGFFISQAFTGIMMLYAAINLLYSFFLKKIIFVDAMVVSFGFVLRILAGSVLITVPTSHWIILCTFFGSLFLTFAKRKHEVDSLADRSSAHRGVLKYYSSDLLQQLIIISATLTIITYALYTIAADTMAHFRTDKLYITLIFVVFGLFYYLHLIHHQTLHGDPTKIFLTNKYLVLTVLFWLMSFFIILSV